MELTFNKHTALALMRALRADNSRKRAFGRRTDASRPNFAPMQRWTKKTLGLVREDLLLPTSLSLDEQPVEIAVPSPDLRIRAKNVQSTVYGQSVPAGSFVDIGNGASISSPELLFVEMAPLMHPLEHLILGHELCGTFSRDANDPYNGPVVYGVAPLTSVDKIARFLQRAHGIEGIDKARTSLSFLNDNAWSPTESLVAALLRLPVDSLGYDLGPLELNPRVNFKSTLPGAKQSRVPDIVIAGTPVGANYDGFVHLDLRRVVNAAIELGAHPELSRPQIELDHAMRALREKVVDDIRRNRELAVDGLTVMPVTKEDLYEPNGMNQVVAQLINMLERFDGRDMSWQRRTLSLKALSEERQRMMLSLLPGKNERNVQVGRFIAGHLLSEGSREVHECWIEL